jgi:mono/diheme cytochrome c family protein
MMRKKNPLLSLMPTLVVVVLGSGVILAGSCTGTQRAQLPPLAEPAAPAPDSVRWPESFGFGTPATAAEIARLDLDVRPDGRGLPPGSGTVVAGQVLYAARCAACHGKTGTEGPQSVLVSSAVPGPAGSRKVKAIGNYWPYATTLFDYIRRAMPFNAPGTLTDAEVYSLTAFLLEANKIIKPDAVMDAYTLPRVEMPAQKLFVPDDRQGGQEIR